MARKQKVRSRARRAADKKFLEWVRAKHKGQAIVDDLVWKCKEVFWRIEDDDTTNILRSAIYKYFLQKLDHEIATALRAHSKIRPDS